MSKRHILKVEKVKRPLKKGEIFLVPCIVKKGMVQKEGRDYKFEMEILPVLNHIHKDVENGQEEAHYHLDYRFIVHRNDSSFPTVKNKHSQHRFGTNIRPTKDFGEIEYHALPVINEEFTGITPVEMISKSKLKMNNIKKNKCPHKGFDLSQVPLVNGVKVCPLHGLHICSR